MSFFTHDPAPLVHSMSISCRSFAAISQSMGVARHEGVAKNTRSSNDRVGFEQFAINHRDRITTVAAIRAANAPGAVLLHKLGALRVI